MWGFLLFLWWFWYITCFVQAAGLKVMSSSHKIQESLILNISLETNISSLLCTAQCAKKVPSNSLELVDFPVGLVEFIYHLSNWQVTFWNFFVGRLSKAKGLQASTQWLQHAGKSIFFAPWVTAATFDW